MRKVLDFVGRNLFYLFAITIICVISFVISYLSYLNNKIDFNNDRSTRLAFHCMRVNDELAIKLHDLTQKPNENSKISKTQDQK